MQCKKFFIFITPKKKQVCLCYYLNITMKKKKHFLHSNRKLVKLVNLIELMHIFFLFPFFSFSFFFPFFSFFFLLNLCK